jgi:hypothetical protein
MNDAEEVTQHQCVDCSRHSPREASEYTLFSSEHGWRLTKGILPSGAAVLEWRCPDCFAIHRGKHGTERPDRQSEAP